MGIKRTVVNELETDHRHEPGLLGQMLAHLMANAARGDEVARTEGEVEGVMRRLDWRDSH